METATHTGFIIAAYACAGGFIGGLIAWVMLDYSAQLRQLADLEKRGVVRRSAAPRATTAAAKEDA
jgi:heme exporter protein CcmD